MQRTVVHNPSSRIVVAMSALFFVSMPVMAENAAIEAMQGYMDFAPYEAGIIMPQQLSKDIFDSVVFIDTRDAVQFAKETIPGGRNIEWRHVLARIDEIPKDKKVVLFCNTGSLSAQAAFALRMAGRENVTVLQTGIIGWRKDGAYKP